MNDTIESTINKWIVEATSNYNDGWTRLHYTKQLSEIKNRLNSLEFLKKHIFFEDFENFIEKRGKNEVSTI